MDKHKHKLTISERLGNTAGNVVVVAVVLYDVIWRDGSLVERMLLWGAFINLAFITTVLKAMYYQREGNDNG